MILGGVADAMAYRNGEWEFLRDGEKIHSQLRELGGLKNLGVKDLLISDDTVMHLATARALVSVGRSDKLEDYFHAIAEEYVKCMDDMNGRSPGITCVKNARSLKPHTHLGYTIPFEKQGGGCGAAMR